MSQNESRSYSPEFSGATAIKDYFGSDSQTTCDLQKNDKPEGDNNKEGNSVVLPNLSLMLPKKFEEDPESQDQINNQDIHNGHNDSEVVNIQHRNKSLGELLLESEELSDTMLIEPPKDKESSVDSNDSQGGRAPKKDMETEEADQTGGQETNPKTNANTDSEKNSPPSNEEPEKKMGEEDAEDSESFTLHLSETQSFYNNTQTAAKSEPPRVDDNENSGSTNSESKTSVTKLEDVEGDGEGEGEGKGAEDDAAESVTQRTDVEESEDSLSNSGPPGGPLQPTQQLSPQPQPMEVGETSGSASEVAKVQEDNEEPCNCLSTCHNRMKKVTTTLNSACDQLENFIKLKRREENMFFLRFLDMLKEVQLIAENEEIVGDSKISDSIFENEETPSRSRKSGGKRKASSSPVKEVPPKKYAKDKSKTGEQKQERETPVDVDFKSVEGMAVFAKWPNSGWYYPGIIEGLSGNDWKTTTNLKVKFYDGLVRDMKNINVLPAHLVPPGSAICDLEDETEMSVVSSDGSNQNWVRFKVLKENSSSPVDVYFNKLAIRVSQMKPIKQQMEPLSDLTPKKMHEVSLDNLVSGRRSRGRSMKGAAAEEANQTDRRRSSSKTSTPPSTKSSPKRSKN